MINPLHWILNSKSILHDDAVCHSTITPMCFFLVRTHLILTPNTHHNKYFFVCLFYSVVCSRLLRTSSLAVSIWCGRQGGSMREKNTGSPADATCVFMCVCTLNSLRLPSMLQSYNRLNNCWIEKTRCTMMVCWFFRKQQQKKILFCKSHQFHDL